MRIVSRIGFHLLQLLLLCSRVQCNIVESNDMSNNTLSKWESSFTDSIEIQTSHRRLQFGRSVMCIPQDPSTKDFYETRTISNSMRNYYRRRGAVGGSCIDSCATLCGHKACYDDYDIVEGDDCQCNRDVKSNCERNSVCNVTSETCYCQAGYTGRPTSLTGCTDINECLSLVNPCGSNAACSNVPGSFNCTCKAGYTGTDPKGTGCTDIDECQSSICGPNGECSNRPGNYNCKCNTGYEWSGNYSTGCVNVNECTKKPSVCPANTVCTDTVGSFFCNCTQGFRTNTTTKQCSDIDECTENPTICGPNTVCTNTIGNYTCACATGFDGTPPNCKADVCTEAGVICNTNAVCDVSTAKCECLDGYDGPNVTTGGECVDIDECQAGSSSNPTCPAIDTVCTNEPGSFQCLKTTWSTCPTGLGETCVTGTCAFLSRSDKTLVCCEVAETCTGGMCCNGAYGAGEVCVTAKDCENNLKCGRKDRFSSTNICCARTFTPITSPNPVCA